MRQKKRHLSVGKHYKRSNKIRLGLLSVSHVGVWCLGILTLLWGAFTHDLLLLQILGAVFALRWLVQVIILSGINNRLDRTAVSYTHLDVYKRQLLRSERSRQHGSQKERADQQGYFFHTIQISVI